LAFLRQFRHFGFSDYRLSSSFFNSFAHFFDFHVIALADSLLHEALLLLLSPRFLIFSVYFRHIFISFHY